MLSISNLTLTARLGGAKVDLLRDVSLTLERGKVLGLVGESGAGKSMIGRVIAGHTPDGFEITHGGIMFDGLDLLTLDTRAWRQLLGRRIAFVPQEPLTALNPVLTIAQTFDEHLAHLGVPARERQPPDAAAAGIGAPAEARKSWPSATRTNCRAASASGC